MLNALRAFARRPMNYSQMLALSFLCIIVVGAVLLWLPVASYSETSFFDALFTSVSATCVTGMTAFDTATHWTAFGKAVLLVLIQIGGLGFMFIVTLFSMATGRKLALHERRMLAENTGSMNLSGVVRLLRRIALATFAIEGCGALLFAIRFCPTLGFVRGFAYAVFHSVSSFCNAGFDLTGHLKPFGSLTMYMDDPLVLLTTAVLVILGGLGFFVWNDVAHCKFRFSQWTLHTKLVITTSAILLLGGWIGFFILEYNASLADASLGVKLLNSFFQSVTVRTVGFDALGQANLSQASILLSYCLMLVGGSPGSTAGGIKTTTLAIMVLNTIATVQKRKSVQIFHRRVEEETVQQALAIIVTYIAAVLVGSVLLCCADPITAENAVYECIAAVSTVGLSMGITQSLSVFSRIVLMLLMFAGRIGGLSLLIALVNKQSSAVLERPAERVLVG